MTLFPWTDLDVRKALGLRVELADADVAYTAVSTDSRTLEPGALYVALTGERFDGHDFVADAVAAGASGVVVSKPVPAARDVRTYPVDDTLVALGALAAHRRTRLDCPVVAITGSAGKTTTKDLLAAALRRTHRVHATRGNRNNRVGVPLTLLDAPSDAEVVVLELGTNEPGEIGTLTAIARPDGAVLTTVGESHLERLGSVEGVLQEKLDILRGLVEHGFAVVGDEPPALPAAAREIVPGARVAGWSERADRDLRAEGAEAGSDGRYRFSWHGHEVHVPMPGRHAVVNALLALAVAEWLGVSPEAAVRGLEGARTADMRGQLRNVGGLTLLVDCYNANPQSVRAALALLEEIRTPAPKVAVLGSMLELGEASDRLHDEVLADAVGRDIGLVVATGAFSDAAARVDRDDDERILAATTWREAYAFLRERLRGDEYILLKASRGIALEGVLPLLEADFGPSAGTVEG